MFDAIAWVLGNMAAGVINLVWALSHPHVWLNLSDPVTLTRFIYYGGSSEFFFAVIDIIVGVMIAGLIRRPILWAVVRGLEFFANWTGRFFAWAGLIMVVQQVLIVVLQRIFRVSEISIGPFGYVATEDLSWFSEELKLYNAMIVALCAAYTFVQGGHVRVDLIYAKLGHTGKRVIDLVGSLIFTLPLTATIWMFGWFFLWRHLVTPKISVTDSLDLIQRKAALLRWNVETIGFSPNGFDAYFLFKVLLISFAGTMFVQGVAFFYRNLLELIEGPESANKHIDLDVLVDHHADDEASGAAGTPA